MLFFLGKVAKTCCYLLKLDMEYWINKSGTLIGSAFIVSILKFYLVLPI